ncbi:MAG TPA: hypothetical protein VFY73_15745 [Ideonella sp.]|jgi:hypothetical protein|uniref:hypothetical protein n=1 Tax=Ideonella sp. TaxID=1929293 RepID=UPI002E32AF40|nr:hypothetical protein [Ideonella sp.]HEX5685474.1 hypothetical protein [Ideonella sp.]
MTQQWKAVLGLVGGLTLSSLAQAQGCYTVFNGQVVEQRCARRLPAVDSASEINRHLSPRCASLNDAMRSAAQQGNYNTMRDLRQEFTRKCADEAQAAVQTTYRERENEREQQQEQRRQAEQAQAQSRATAQQCDGMRDVIQSKRKRETTLNPTEVAALRQLEASFNERCLRR